MRINARFDFKGLSLWPFIFRLTHLVQRMGGGASHAASPSRTGISGMGSGASRAPDAPTACTQRALLALRPSSVPPPPSMGCGHVPSFATRRGGGSPARRTTAQRSRVRDAAGAWCHVEQHLCCAVLPWIAHLSDAPWKRRAGSLRAGRRGRAFFHFLFLSVSV